MGRRVFIGKEIKVGEWDFLEEIPEKREEQVKLCPVCSTEILEGSLIFECPYCGNIMHKRCVGPWLKSHGICPICKRPLSQGSQASEGG
ncbi:MAG: hypothetical protein N3F65_02450 [Nitrososphaeria archaeon]|nr:hypothetical protein [Nitrososphaeria archaeon]